MSEERVYTWPEHGGVPARAISSSEIHALLGKAFPKAEPIYQTDDAEGLPETLLDLDPQQRPVDPEANPTVPTHIIYREGQVEIWPYVGPCPACQVILVAKNFAGPVSLVSMLIKILRPGSGLERRA